MRWKILVLSLSFAIGATSQSPGEDSAVLRVLCYNIHHAEGVDRSLDIPRIARVIQSVNPDIVALQEVDKKVDRTESVDQPGELAKLTGMEVAFGGNIALQGGEYGNALLSRFPIVSMKNHALPNIGSGEQRGVLEVGLHLPNREVPLLILVTHLDHRRDEKERVESAKKIDQLMADRSDMPAILAGDLNATPDSLPLKILCESWKQTNNTPSPTIPVELPTQQIDFILVRPAKRWHVKEFKVLDEAIASDHRAIFTILEFD